MKQEIKISKEVEVVHSICSMADTNDDIDTNDSENYQEEFNTV